MGQEVLQLGLDIFAGQPQPAGREREPRIHRLITLSDIETIIYRRIAKVEPNGQISAAAAVGGAIDHFLIPANFIYRYRDDYCFPPELHPDWDLQSVFARFYPTGYRFGEILEILEKHRPRFCEQNPLNPANLALERRNIKRKLVPVWQEIAKRFKIDFFNLQGVMDIERNSLIFGGRTASEEDIAQITGRIIHNRFDDLVDDDKDYTYIARPDCLLAYESNGQTFHIQVEPDYIKRLRERRKTVKKRHIVTKRIVGDFKDSDKRDLTDFSTPYGKTMLVYNWLLSQIGERFKWNQLTFVRLNNRQKRRVFLIPQEVGKQIDSGSVQTALEFLRADGSEIFSPMPQLSEDLRDMAKTTLDQALLLSQKPVLAS